MSRIAMILALITCASAGADDLRSSATGKKIGPGVAVATFKIW